MPVSIFNKPNIANNTANGANSFNQDRPEAFHKGKTVAPINNTIPSVGRGKSFWDMSFPQKFVFGLGVVAAGLGMGTGSSGVVARMNGNNKAQETDTVNSNLQVCHQYHFLQQVGPLNFMPDYPLKKSDALFAGFGLQKREYLVISKKFTALVEDLDCVNEMFDIYTLGETYMKSRCGIFNILKHHRDTNQFFESCDNYAYKDNLIHLINGIETYQSTLFEVMKFVNEGYEMPKELYESINYMMFCHKPHIGHLFYSLKNHINHLYKLLEIQSKTVEPSKREIFEFHNKAVRSILDKSKPLFKKCKERDIFNVKKATGEEIPILKIQQSAAYIEESIKISQELLSSVRKHREKINYLPQEKYTDKIKRYFSDGLTMFYCTGLFSAVSFPLYKILEKFYRKPNIKAILDRHPIEKIDNFEQQIKKCEQTSKMPDNWCIPRLDTFSETKKPLNKIRKKRNKASEQTDNFSVKNQERTAKHDIPKYPWDNLEIPFNDPHIKPIMLENGIIVAYAYFDSETLESKFTEPDIKKMQEIHTDGKMASHARNAAGYKLFQHKKQQIWEFKLAGKNRLYGVPIKADNKGKAIKIAPLVIFDISLRKKLGGND